MLKVGPKSILSMLSTFETPEMTALPEPATPSAETAVRPPAPAAPPAPACDPFDQGLPRPVVLRLLAGPGRFTRADLKLYVRTPHWEAMRAEAFAMHGHACMLCSSPIGLQVHHRGREAYRHLFREIVSRHLTVLCSTCHRRHHRK